MWGRKPISQSSSFEQQIRAATVLDAAILSEKIGKAFLRRIVDNYTCIT
jgi:hypothetical protein